MSEIMDVSHLPTENEFMQPETDRKKDVLHENWLLDKENATSNETNIANQVLHENVQEY